MSEIEKMYIEKFGHLSEREKKPPATASFIDSAVTPRAALIASGGMGVIRGDVREPAATLAAVGGECAGMLFCDSASVAIV